MPLEIRAVATQTDMDDALSVRRAVFIEEQRVSEEEEIDEHDRDEGWLGDVVQMTGYLDGRPVVTGRLMRDSTSKADAHIGRVAVLKELRGKGHGKALMLALHDEALRQGFHRLRLGAQLHAIPFYESLGYVPRGEIFLDAGIEHRWMDVRL
jgi:predicted GNAT family N-acyltransferase